MEPRELRMNGFDRRRFLHALVACGVGAALGDLRLEAAPARAKAAAKPISGSWFEFQHHSAAEGEPWNAACAGFTAQQWDAKVKEIADIGLDYLVLMSTAVHFKAFYQTEIYPRYPMACEDPIEAVLAAADKYGIKFFIGAGFYGQWDSPTVILDPVAAKKRLQGIEELAKRYGHHPSFHGWYWPDEACIEPYYSNDFIRYVNTCSKLGRSLCPKAKILIAPYGTRIVTPDDNYIKQLDQLDVDIIAYQDEIGVRKSKVRELPAFYEGLKKAHDRASRPVAIWADVEIFEFAGEVYNSALLPAAFERVESQLAAISPWVETILIYQYQGMMNKPGSTAFAGHPSSTRLYSDYAAWLKRHHPERLKRK